jgi:hypothetical protein
MERGVGVGGARVKNSPVHSLRSLRGLVNLEDVECVKRFGPWPRHPGSKWER